MKLLIKRFQAWRKRRYWEARHLRFLRLMINEDWRWLAHSELADQLTTRYKRAASESWYELEHESSDAFRRRVGLTPNYGHDAPAGQQGGDKP